MALNTPFTSALLSIVLVGAACTSSDDTEPAATTSSARTATTTQESASTTTEPAPTTSMGADTDATMASALATGVWSDNVTLDFGESTYTIASDGVPSHEYPDEWAVPIDPINISADNATVRSGLVSAQNYSYELPLDPVYSDTSTVTPLGTIGIMVSGAALYNPYEGGGGVALDGNFDLGGVFFIDSCNGHPQGQGAYHYHGVPYCITDAVDADGEHSTMIGVLLDGFAVYGPNDVGGVEASGLDECSGHTGPTPEFPDGIYHYHLTASAPYSITCFHGEVDAAVAGGAVAGGVTEDGQPDDGEPDAPADDGAPGPDLARAAATLGVSEQELRDALGPPPPDFAATADALGITVDDLMAALG